MSYSNTTLIYEFMDPNSTFSDTERIVATVSQVSGYLSLCVWLFAQLPQIIENHLNQSVEGVSLLFLSCWMGGDATNLVGCILTGALPFQTCLASYYCFIDCILALQFWYYTKIYPYQKVHHNMLQSPDMMRPQQTHNNDVIPLRTNRFKQLSPQMSSRTPIQIASQVRGNVDSDRIQIPENSSLTQKLFGAIFVGSYSAKGANSQPIPTASDYVDNNPQSSLSRLWQCITQYALLAANAICSLRLHIHKQDIGRISAWTCSCLYVSSRTPQILENYRKKSTKGISLFLFLFAMLGNSLYTVCIVSDLYLIYYDNGYMDEWAFRDALTSQLPFIVGSSGTVLFDCIILFQCWLYSSPKSRGSPATHQSKQHQPDFRVYETDILMESSSDFKEQKKTKKGHKASSSQDYFKKPDWYTNNVTHLDPLHRTPNNNSGDNFYKRSHRPSESSVLLSGHMSSYSSIIASPPPSHYITGTSFSNTPTNMNQGNSGNIITNTFQSISNSFTRSSFSHSRQQGAAVATAIVNTKSPQSGSFGESPLSTSLIPSIIGTYSSVSKKMNNEAKIPFSPIDFLHDEFHNNQQGSGDTASIYDD